MCKVTTLTQEHLLWYKKSNISVFYTSDFTKRLILLKERSIIKIRQDAGYFIKNGIPQKREMSDQIKQSCIGLGPQNEKSFPI